MLILLNRGLTEEANACLHSAWVLWLEHERTHLSEMAVAGGGGDELPRVYEHNFAVFLVESVSLAQDKYPRAFVHFIRAIADFFPSNERLRPMFERVALRYQDQQPARALAIFRLLTDRYPQSAVLWNARGVCEYRAGLAKESILSLKKALTLDSGLIEAHLRLATVYISQKRMADAIDLFERALKANRDNPEALELIAESYLGVRPRRAVQIYTELTDHDPKNAVLWKNRGVCEYRAGAATCRDRHI